MRKVALLSALLILLAAASGLAQEERQVEQKQTGEAAEKGEIKRILELPKRTQEAREAGIPEQDVREVLEAAKQHKLSPEETDAVLAESTRAARENGNVENFGSFVKAKMNEGLRGKDLANAIHEEHRARGKGKGAHGEAKGKAHKEMEKHGGKAEAGQGHGDAKKHQEKEQHMEGEQGAGQAGAKGEQPQGESGGKQGGKGGKGDKKSKGGS